MTNPPSTKEIRLYVDGELTPEESSRLENLIENDEALCQRVDFERKLKRHISDVITRQADTAPEELANQIRAKLDQVDRTVVGPISPQPHIRWLYGPSRANIFAVAATLMIVAGAVLFGIFGQPIDDIGPVPDTDVIMDSAKFVASEHNRCVNDEASRNQKILFTDPAIAYQFISDHLETMSVPMIDLSEIGYDFSGAGPCGVPSAERSAHVMFRKQQSDYGMPQMVSLFMVADSGQFRFNGSFGDRPGEWADCDGGLSSDRRVLIATDGRIAYFLCCCDEEDMERIARAISFQIRFP